MKDRQLQLLCYRRQHVYGTSNDVPNETLQVQEPVAPVLPANKWKFKKGLFLASLSGLLFAASSAIVKNATYAKPLELMFFPYVGGTLFTAPVVIRLNVHPLVTKKDLPLMLCRSIIVVPTLYLFITAVHEIPVAEATVIYFSSPIFTTILGRIFLKEPCGTFTILGLVLMIAGNVLTTKLPLLIYRLSSSGKVESNIERHLIGCTKSLTAALGMSIFYTIARKQKHINESVSVLNGTAITASVTTVLIFSTGTFVIPSCGWNAVQFMGFGVLYFMGAYFMVVALQIESAASVSVARASSDIIFIYILQVTVFKEIPDVYGIMGTIITFSSIFIINLASAKLPLRFQK